MIRAHVAAVYALLDAVANLNVYDGVVPNTPALPYVVLWANQGAPSSNTVEQASTRRDFTIQTTYVGSTPEQARWAAEKAQGALLDVTPTVAGRQCWPLVVEASQSTRVDLDVDPPVFLSVDVWRLASVPA